jgi:hypothetical protein
MMIVEGVIAMIWAAAAMSLMNGEDLSVLLANEGLLRNSTYRNGVLRNYWWNSCFRRYRFTDNFWDRAARMIIADYLKIDQKALKTDL